MTRKIAVVAVGGNALIKDPKFPDMPHQWDAARETATHLASMVEQGWDIIVTHGNGPQVGYILRRAEIAAHYEGMHSVPLDVIVSDTQGSIGYMLKQALENEYHKRGIDKSAVAIVTQVVVDEGDPAMQHPTKPIGGFLTEEQAEQFRREGWTVVEDAGRGLRRVVASPKPKQIIELDVIRTLVGRGVTVVAVGGGGIPVVVNPRGELRGAYAVIDKDRASALLAAALNADLLLISTGVEKVAINFNKPDVRWLDRMTLDEAHQYMAEGHFASGSMLPKIEAAVDFLEAGGREVLITSPENIARGLAGETGTRMSAS
ncbi:MAG: carbamate kinase [Anaerolineae bacterium]|nr:carbamate kinase [Anaerolineae bacterium]